MSLPKIITTKSVLKSVHLKKEMEIVLFMPDDLQGNEVLNLLVLNDGQDANQLRLEATLTSLYIQKKIEPLVVVGVSASEERLLDYGVAGVPDYGNRGSKAQQYTDFVIKELMPFVQKEVGMPIGGHRAIAGFSLGGLSAFDIAWNNDTYFDLVGVFSGSFWWRTKDLKDGYTDADRIMHKRISETVNKPGLKFWLMTGTEDEKADRNKNYIIDSIDDTIDIVKELLIKGFKRPEDIAYFEMVGGNHDVPTWAKALPYFLTWAFCRKK